MRDIFRVVISPIPVSSNSRHIKMAKGIYVGNPKYLTWKTYAATKINIKVREMKWITRDTPMSVRITVFRKNTNAT